MKIERNENRCFHGVLRRSSVRRNLRGRQSFLARRVHPPHAKCVPSSITAQESLHVTTYAEHPYTELPPCDCASVFPPSSGSPADSIAGFCSNTFTRAQGIFAGPSKLLNICLRTRI